MPTFFPGARRRPRLAPPRGRSFLFVGARSEVSSPPLPSTRSVRDYPRRDFPFFFLGSLLQASFCPGTGEVFGGGGFFGFGGFFLFFFFLGVGGGCLFFFWGFFFFFLGFVFGGVLGGWGGSRLGSAVFVISSKPW